MIALVIGSTGAVGKQIVNQLCMNSAFNSVVAIARSFGDDFPIDTKIVCH